MENRKPPSEVKISGTTRCAYVMLLAHVVQERAALLRLQRQGDLEVPRFLNALNHGHTLEWRREINIDYTFRLVTIGVVLHHVASSDFLNHARHHILSQSHDIAVVGVGLWNTHTYQVETAVKESGIHYTPAKCHHLQLNGQQMSEVASAAADHVELAGRELGVVSKIDPLVTELTTDLVYTIQTTNNQLLSKHKMKKNRHSTI
jgi:hypothetical protein